MVVLATLNFSFTKDNLPGFQSNILDNIPDENHNGSVKKNPRILQTASSNGSVYIRLIGLANNGNRSQVGITILNNNIPKSKSLAC